MFYFRKHLGRDPNSLYRAVAECLFKSQRFQTDVKNEVEQFLQESGSHDVSDDGGVGDVSPHRVAEAVAKVYDVDIEIVSAADSRCSPYIITPESGGRDVFDDPTESNRDVCDENDSGWVVRLWKFNDELDSQDIRNSKRRN